MLSHLTFFAVTVLYYLDLPLEVIRCYNAMTKCMQRACLGHNVITQPSCITLCVETCKFPRSIIAP